MTPGASSLIYRSPKLGAVPYVADDIVCFPQGIPGFERLRAFLLVTRDECAPFIFLASLENADVAIPLLPFSLVSAGPEPDLPFDARAALGRTENATVGWYSVVAIGREAREMVANLRAPIVVNLDSRVGCQVILSDETLPLCASIGA